MIVVLRMVSLFCLLCGMGVQADDLRPASLTITADGPETYRVLWKVPAKGDRRLMLDVSLDDSAEAVSPVRRKLLGGAYLESWQMRREAGLTGLGLVIEGLDASYTDVLLRATDHDQSVVSAVINAGQPRYVFEVFDESGSRVSDYLMLGVEHILIGLDHLLFVACLVYLSGTRRKLLWTITGFTVAHSVTLFMAALGWVNVPIPAVEAAIALSIVFLALEIARNDPQSISVRYPVVVAASFGLLHGFGFASVLADIGLPKTDAIAALLLFNIGVEVGQLVFVALLMALAYALSSWIAWLSPARLRLAVSYVSGSVATIWLVTRLSAF